DAARRWGYAGAGNGLIALPQPVTGSTFLLDAASWSHGLVGYEFGEDGGVADTEAASTVVHQEVDGPFSLVEQIDSRHPFVQLCARVVVTVAFGRSYIGRIPKLSVAPVESHFCDVGGGDRDGRDRVRNPLGLVDAHVNKFLLGEEV